jgi:N6-adenosine-specific RNA methylase IME4
MNIDNEFRGLIPPLTTEEYAGLEQSIIAEGCRDALITWNDILVDGHNRHAICTKYGIPFNTSEKTFENRDKVKEWIILNQFGRRNLSAYDRSVLALRLKELFAEKARERMLAGTPVLKSEQGRTVEKIAHVAGVGKDTIAKVQKIEERATPETKEKVKSGEVSINQAYQTVRREEKIKTVKEKFIDPIIETKSIDILATDKKYNIIYADPAWDYTEWPTGTRNPYLHYKCMGINDICNLPVKNIADIDCVLFLWVTYPMLQDSFKVIESWGFKYKTAGFVWVKKNKNTDTPFIGCGSWTRANSELCLIATKGSMLRLDASISQIIESPIEEHSKKPVMVRELITRLVGELPRIELFSRQAVNGWDCWGNEV